MMSCLIKNMKHQCIFPSCDTLRKNRNPCTKSYAAECYLASQARNDKRQYVNHFGIKIANFQNVKHLATVQKYKV